MMSPKGQHQAMYFQVSALVSLKGQHQEIMRIMFTDSGIEERNGGADKEGRGIELRLMLNLNRQDRT